jgi:hypothetical protein
VHFRTWKVISASIDLEDFDPSGVTELLETLRPDNMQLLIVAKENEEFDDLVQEPVYVPRPFYHAAWPLRATGLRPPLHLIYTNFG